MDGGLRGLGWWLVLGVLSTGACTRTNPAFVEGGDPTEGSATSQGSATVPTASDGTADGGTVSAGSQSGGSQSGGSEGPQGPCITNIDCDDGVFCNGAEACVPTDPSADDLGCVKGDAPCADGANCQEGQGVCVTDCQLGADADSDGQAAVECGGTDCNDSNPDVFAGATEVCDDGTLDEDCDPSTYGHRDEDGDGLVSSACCNQADGGALSCGPDCDDSLAGITDAGTDWAHCVACGQPCDVLEACMGGVCTTARRVFVSSTVHSGNLGGLTQADEQCKALADSVDLGGQFGAFLAGQTEGVTRLEAAAVPYVRLDGVRIANNWNDLVDQSIQAPLFVDEQRNRLEAFDRAWTGLMGDPSPQGNCNDWTTEEGGCMATGEPCGTAGDVNSINMTWDGPAGPPPECSFLFHLYCVEQMN